MLKTVLIIALAVFSEHALTASSVNLGTYTTLGPNSTFLYQNTTGAYPDTCASVQATPACNMNGALFINLTALGVTAGTELILQGTGDICYTAGCVASQAQPVNLAGVFTSNTIELGPNNQDRLPGALPFVPASTNSTFAANNVNTFYGNQLTGFVPDFVILTSASLHVVVPQNPNSSTTYLAIGVIDSFFADNTNPSGAVIGITLQQVASVPEAGAGSLLAAGLVLCALGKHRRRTN